MKVAFAGLKKLKVRDTALLSQEGSTIETAVEIVRGGGSRAKLFNDAF